MTWCAVLFIFAFFHFLAFQSCARMGNPDGGWYDDTPPRVLSATPVDKGVNVKSRKSAILFDEYINVEDVQSKVIVSPPQIEQAEIRASGKRILIELKDSLKENTTYTIDFSDAITDKNENNPMGNYTYSFSTGDQIDTLEVSGYCLNAENLEPIKGILVGLYMEPDSLSSFEGIFHTTPFVRVSRTNGSGRFTIKGVAPGRYYTYALMDADGDFLFNQKSEMVGYSHDIVSPSWKPDTRQDTIWIDSLHIDNILRVPYTHFLPDDVTLLCFQEPQTDRYLVKTERKDPEKFEMFFTYGSDSLPKIRGLNFEADSAFVLEASEHRDTLTYWLRDTTLINTDSLEMELTYLMTDSTGVLIEKVDTVTALPKMSYEKRKKLELKELEKWQKEQERKKKRGEPYDSIKPLDPLVPKLSASGQINPLQVIRLEMPAPLTRCDSAAIHLYSMIDSVWYHAPFTFRQIKTRTFELQGEWREGVEYSLEIDSAAFESIYGLVSKPIKQGLKVQTADELSMLNINLSGISDTVDVVLELLDSSDKVVRQEKAGRQRSVDFFYLKPSTYFLRAFEDWNRNGRWDTGRYDDDLQAEPVYYFSEAIECKQKWDVSRSWNVTAKPRYQQKPAKITKQKPDKEKQLKNRNLQRAKEKGVQYLNSKGVRM
jgi:uncharacterized protein (DUF2141 family)